MKNLLIMSFLLSAFVGILCAQEIEPRAYSYTPVNLNATGFAYSLSPGSVVTDAKLPLKDLEVTTHIPALFYMRTFHFFGKLGRFQATVPFAQMALVMSKLPAGIQVAPGPGSQMHGYELV